MKLRVFGHVSTPSSVEVYTFHLRELARRNPLGPSASRWNSLTKVYTIGLQPPPEKVVRVSLGGLTTFSGGGWSPRVYTCQTSSI